MEIIFLIKLIKIYQTIEDELETQSANVSVNHLRLRIPTAKELMEHESEMATSTPQEVNLSYCNDKIDGSMP